MVLNYIFIAFFLIGFVVALFKLLILGDLQMFTNIGQSLFSLSKTGFEIALGLTGIMALWLGLMRVAEKAGAIDLLSRVIRPFFKRIFPDIPDHHPANGAIMMNFAANMLGLDNAATPLGLKAMNELQTINPETDTASNPMIMFLVLNTSSITIIPITIMMYRAQAGAANPADVFVPILLATTCSSLVGLIVVSIYQRINLFQPVVLAYLGGIGLLIFGLMNYILGLGLDDRKTVSEFIGWFLILSIITFFIGYGLFKKINVYEEFIDGAKDGFTVAIKIIPYLVAILVAIAVFRSSGAMDAVFQLLALTGVDQELIQALPTAVMKPLSGSGARGLMVEAMNTYGAESFTGILASMFQGSTETTFYVIAVYFGAVNIKKTRYTVTAGLLADLAGILAAIFLAYLFFK